ncbi:MAG: hypothetical protein Ct9H300mP2_0120 [Candidatus Neomarinimicrobiota bacterium]|nr:MAG: hypothetical protein Ct9H300mP2_0120 [Candidatus Neomarinimicrobiota bacterium]
MESDQKDLISVSKNGLQTNFWMDIPEVNDGNIRKPDKLVSKIMNTSSFKLNWVLDPFMNCGDVGVASKRYGRRFIGFETTKTFYFYQ